MTNPEPVRTSLIQGVINEINLSASHKQRAIDLLGDLRAWLDNSLQRDIAFHDRLVQAVDDNAPQIDTTIMESDIKKIAATYGAGNGQTQESQSGQKHSIPEPPAR